MATMNISLPQKMKEWVEEQVATGRYANASDYVRDILREDQKRVAAIAETQALIDEGLASGVSDRSLDEVFENIRSRVRQELADGESQDNAGGRKRSREHS